MVEGAASKRTAISVFIDDTTLWPAGAVAELIDFCEAQGVRGKVSLIPGLGTKAGRPHIGERKAPVPKAFMATLAGAGARGFDIHMELMTHNRLWDFSTGAQSKDGPHESIWIYEPEVPVADFEAYFGNILDAAKTGGVTINGVTVPGCDCEACGNRWEAIQAEGHSNVSDHAWQALLNLAEQGRFGVPVVAVFSDEADKTHPTRMISARGGFGVYDARLDMTVLDYIGFQGVDMDFYITEDGRGGRIPELVLSGADHCFFCVHWLSMNPTKPEGWAAFQEVVRRINTTLGDRIEWVKPSEYGQRLLAG